MSAPRRRRRWIVPLASASFVFTLAACSGGGSQLGLRSGVSRTTTTSAATPPGSTTPTSTVTTGPPAHLLGGATPLAAPSGPSVAPPSSIASNCSTDVTRTLRKWFKSLPEDQTVVVPSGACYLVNKGLRLKNTKGLTIYGGTYRSSANLNGKVAGKKGAAVFSFVGGSGLTLEAMHIEGANQGGYHPKLAFASGIDIEGLSDVTIRSVTVDRTYGDGITLSPLRGGTDNKSGTIVAPSRSVTIRDVTIDGIGRQAVTFASVAGAQLSDLIVRNPGLDVFDLEADQKNEGTTNVTIDACETSGGAYFFANGGAGRASGTHDITVSHCSARPTGGTAIYVMRPGGKHGGHAKAATAANGNAPASNTTTSTKANRPLRGPITFVADDISCQVSVYTGCVQVSGGTVTVSESRLEFPAGKKIHGSVYSLASGSQAQFTRDTVRGYGREGKVTGAATVHVAGGEWVPAG